MRAILSPKSEKQLRKLSKINQMAVVRKIRQIRDKGFLSGKEKLKGVDGYKVRVGDYRIVYKKTKKLIYIVLIGHRKEVYKIMKILFG